MGEPDFNFDDLLELFGDEAHKETDKRINRVRKRLADEYKQAEKELKKKTDQYFAKFKKQDEEKRKLVKQGKLSQDKYIEWRRNKMLYGETMRQNTERMAEYLANVDQRAADIINGQLAGVYATNYNFASYQIESSGRAIGANFNLHDDRTVARLARDNPRLLPKVDPDKVKGQAWSKRKINNVITQGILQGKAIPDIAKGMSKVVGMEWNSAVRNARTAMTGAENAGRLGSYQDAKGMGIKLRKQWMATLDERTRESHAAIDGEIVDIDKKFSNGLMYPADPDGEPAEVYNCRCTMVADLEGVPKEPPAQTFEEWQEEKKQPLHTNSTILYEQLKNFAGNNRVSHKPVKTIRPMTHEDTIAKLAGGDMTTGSCVSQMFAYCSNRHGIDVTDFRGGSSCDMFSRNMNIPKVFKTANADFIEHKVEREAQETAKILAGLEKDKEYCLVVGRHASIIRNSSEHGLQYLELQSELHKGWMPFETDSRNVADTLYRRFGCRKRIQKSRWDANIIIRHDVWLADVDSFKMTEEFKDIMGYINTATDKQKKGVRGFAK